MWSARVPSSSTTLALAEPLTTLPRSARSRVSLVARLSRLRGHPHLPAQIRNCSGAKRRFSPTRNWVGAPYLQRKFARRPRGESATGERPQIQTEKKTRRERDDRRAVGEGGKAKGVLVGG